MGTITSQITSLTIVYSTVYSGADQRKHQSSASLDFVLGIHREPVNFPHKWPVTRKMFPFDDVIMTPADAVMPDYLQVWTTLVCIWTQACHWHRRLPLRPSDAYMRRWSNLINRSTKTSFSGRQTRHECNDLWSLHFSSGTHGSHWCNGAQRRFRRHR